MTERIKSVQEGMLWARANNIFTLIEHREGDEWREAVLEHFRQLQEAAWDAGFQEGIESGVFMPPVTNPYTE